MAGYNSYLLDPNGKPVFDSNGKPDLVNGELYISVSQILSMESTGDFLTRWLLTTFGGEPDPMRAYQAFMDRVSNLGTRLHEFIECDLKGIRYPKAIDDDMIPGIESWVKFRRNHEIETIDTEKILFSRRLRVAGTRDSRLRVNGKIYQTDLKTGSVQDKAFCQLAAYHIMSEEIGEDSKDDDYLVLGGKDSKSKVADGGEMIMHTRESWFKGRMSREDLKLKFAILRTLWYYHNTKSRKFEAIIKHMDRYVDYLAEDFKKSFQDGLKLMTPEQKEKHIIVGKSKGKKKNDI